MLYTLARPLTKIVLGTYFRKVYVLNRENIPPVGQPLIIAANHPTAFIDPCIAACWMDRPLYFMARGSVFTNAFYRFLLNGVHIVPIYRAADSGWDKVKDNYDSFEKCYSTLAEGKPVMLLAEGHTKHEKRLRPIKKATARLAFGTLSYQPSGKSEPFDMNLQVLPVTFNYTDSNEARSEVYMSFGKPIHLNAYRELYAEHPQKAFRAFSDDLRDGLAANIINIADPKDDGWIDPLLTYKRNELPTRLFPVTSFKPRPQQVEQDLAQYLSALPATEKEALQGKVKTYQKVLKEMGVVDRAIVQQQHNTVQTLMVLIGGFLPFLLGYIINFIPRQLANWIARTKIKKIEFKASVKVGVILVSYFFLLLTVGIIAVATQNWMVLLATVFFPFWSYFAYLYEDIVKRRRAERAFAKLSSTQQQRLISLRQKLLPAWIVEP